MLLRIYNNPHEEHGCSTKLCWSGVLWSSQCVGIVFLPQIAISLHSIHFAVDNDCFEPKLLLAGFKLWTTRVRSDRSSNCVPATTRNYLIFKKFIFCSYCSSAMTTGNRSQTGFPNSYKDWPWSSCWPIANMASLAT